MEYLLLIKRHQFWDANNKWILKQYDGWQSTHKAKEKVTEDVQLYDKAQFREYSIALWGNLKENKNGEKDVTSTESFSSKAESRGHACCASEPMAELRAEHRAAACAGYAAVYHLPFRAKTPRAL